MSKKSRILKSLFVVVLAVAFVSQMIGCSNKASATDPAASTVAASTAAASTESTAPAAKDYSTPLKISWAVYGDQQIDINQDAFSQMWGKKFNLQWDMIAIQYDQWDEKVRIWTNSQDLPDVVQWQYNHVDGMSYAEQGLVKKLPDDWKTKWPDAAKAYENTGVGSMLESTFGGTYFLPRPIFFSNKPVPTLISNQGIYMRKDWMTAVGAEIKPYYTVPEILDIARQIKQKDPGKVGSKLAAIGGGVDRLPWYFIYPQSTYSSNASEYYQDANGNFQWGPASPETLQGLKYYQQAYDEGLLTKEFFAQGINYEDNFTTAGVSAMNEEAHMAQIALRYADKMQKNLNVKPEDWMHYAFAVGDDGKYHVPESNNYWGALIFSPSLADDKFERVMDVIDYSCTEQGQHEIRMGIEGTDWKLDDQKQLVSLLQNGETAVTKYASIRPFYHNLYILSDDFGLVNPTYPKEYRDLAYNTYQTKNSLVDATSLGKTNWDVFFYTSDARKKVESINLSNEYAQLVVAKGNMEDKWNEWVAKQMKIVQPVLDEMNAKLKK